MCNIRLLILIIIIVCCHLIGCLQATFGIDDELGEGSQCILENGNLGICKKLPECPYRVKGTWNSTGRCGFDHSIEIVCCPLRPAEVACQQYDKENLIGVSAEPFEFPYMVALGYKSEETGEDASPNIYSCAGSLISSEHVLTTANCVHNIYGRVPVEVRLGNLNINSNEGTQRIPIRDIITHPQYTWTEFYNDVAILKLKSKVQISDKVKPICLETKSVANMDITPSTNLVAIGWDVNVDDIELSGKMMRTPSLSLVNNDECNKSYLDYTVRLPHGIDGSMVCAIDTNTTRMEHTCPVKSGGPLLLSSKSGDSVIAITGFGSPLGSRVPCVYTAIYAFLDWIEEHVWPTLQSVQE